MGKKQKTKIRSGSIGFGGLLTLIFITLKLCGVIGWSWWWVLSPLWIPLAFVLAIFVVIGVLVVLAMAVGAMGKALGL